MKARNEIGGCEVIRKAEKDDIATVSASYQELFAYEEVYGNQTNWVPGLYPSASTVQAASEDGTLYVLEEDGVICGSMILNHIQPPEYQLIDWRYTAEAAKVLVLHTLCIPHSQKGKGYGKQFIAFAMQYAAQTDCKTVRLDTWDGNRPAAALYVKMGFRLAGTAIMLLQGTIREQQIFFEREVGKTI